MQKYREVLERSKEQERTINFQKTKIAALEAELEDTLKQLSKSETKAADFERVNTRLTEEAKKFNDKVNSLNTQV